MPIDVSCRLVFLGSPSGLTPERELCREVCRAYNETRTLDAGVSFFVLAWEDVPGGVGRAQDRINPRLDECDFAVFLFKDTWGSPPARDNKYTSGTEEEFFRALELLADAHRPMRDILVVFETQDPDRLRDPGENLKKVLSFRARLEESKSLMYENYDSLESLRRTFDRKMVEWSKPLGAKGARRIEIPDVELDTSTMRTRARADLLASASGFAKEGLLMQAEATYAAATEDNDPNALLEFAKFMRRTGRLERALALNRRVVENPDLLISRAAASVALRVRAMSNIGVIQRKQGDISASVRTLSEAVRTAGTARESISQDEYCYALDNLGFSFLRLGDFKRAQRNFETADQVRADSGTSEERAQSAINLGRLHLALNELEIALEYFSRAEEALGTHSDAHLRANALSGRIEALVRLGRSDDVESEMAEALALNEKLHNRDGISIVHGLWARWLLQLGRIEEADSHLQKASETVNESGNAQGRGVVAWLRAERARVGGDLDSARALLVDLERLADEYPNSSLRSDISALREALQNT